MRPFVERVVPNDDELSTLCRIADEVSPTRLRGREHEAVTLAEQHGKAAATTLRRLSDKVRDLIAHRGAVGVIEIDLSRALNRYEPIPPTPADLDSPGEHALFPLDVMRCAIIGAAAGYSYGYSGQGNANLCDDLMPTNKNHRPGASTRFAVNWHTEDAPYNRGSDNRLHPTCDVISFAYLRNPSADLTRVNMPNLSALRPDTLEALKAYQFKLLTSYYQKAAKSNIETLTSFVYGPDNWIRFSFARISEQKDEYRNNGNLLSVIEELIESLDRNSTEVSSVPGDIAFIDNMRVAHARAPFKNPARFDGSDRWLRRLGVVAAPRRDFLEQFMDDPARRLVNNELLLPYLQSLPAPGQICT
jgi:TfdA family taurine catabolism dioxygenase TauD